MYIAIIREVSPDIAQCELTHVARQPIDPGLARAQHRQYEDGLAELGCEVLRLPAEPGLPDSVFVEDTAIVLDELAIITRPGAEARRAETASIARALRTYRKLLFIAPPGTLDGGDVLQVGRTLFVGRSSRSNDDGIEHLRRQVAPFGYTIKPVGITGCLHLKSAVTQVAVNTLLINRAWVDERAFPDFDLIDVDPAEPWGANALLIGETVIHPLADPRTRERMQKRGLAVRALDMSELAKAEGGVTCCSLLVRM